MRSRYQLSRNSRLLNLIVLEVVRLRVDAVCSCILGGIASCSASNSAFSYTFLPSVVCLSVVCLSVHCRLSHTPCLNHSRDLDAIWQIHLWGPVGVSDPRWKEDLGVLLQIVAKPSVLCCHLANTKEELGGLATAIPPFVKLLWSLFVVTIGNRVAPDTSELYRPGVHKPRSEIIVTADVEPSRDRDEYYNSVGRQNALAFNRHAFSGRNARSVIHNQPFWSPIFRTHLLVYFAARTTVFDPLSRCPCSISIYPTWVP